MSAGRTMGRRLRRLGRDNRASVIIEFAMAFPVLAVLFLGGYVITDMIACSRKVSVAAREVTDLATRYPELTTAQVSTIENSAQQILVPYNVANATVNLTEVQVIDSTHVKVVWSQSLNGTARSAGASITVNGGLIPNYLLPSSTTAQSPCTTAVSLTGNGGCLMLGEVTYSYTPVFNIYGAQTMNDAIYLAPRLSSSIPLIS